LTAYEWWQRGVVYQIYPRSFKDTSSNGVGDLQGIIDKLDYLNDGTENSLGVDAIWISPFYPSPMADFGYDIADYRDIDPIFGDLASFEQLVAEAHQRKIKIIVDYVPNHTSDEHAWFVESRSSRDNPKRDWYIWRDAKADGSPPNNWGSLFGGPAWTWDETTQQYYFHQFHRKQPDLNWRNPQVQQAMFDVLRFWMQRGVDGFRMDVVYMIWKHPDMPDQPVNADAIGRGRNDIFSGQQQIYAYNYEGIHDVMKSLRRVLDESQVIGIGEIWLSLEERMKYYGDDAGEEFHIPFNFDLIGAVGELNEENIEHNNQAAFFRERVEAYEHLVPDGCWPNYVLGSHDVPRLASRSGGEAQARVLAMMLLTLRGTPTLYMGDEIGMVNGAIAAEQIQDPQGKQLGVEHTRDVCRTPMQWDASNNAGFSTTATWLPVNRDFPQRNVKLQSKDSQSILSLYRNLNWYRKQHESLAVGDYQTLDSPAETYVYLRTHHDERHLIALNFSDREQVIRLPFAGTIVMNTMLNRDGEISDELLLAANEGVLIQLN